MYLKSLTLRGFKSFADKTTMVFDPGLTVVVGPNGSGKSNISDAILWVLGEQRARMLRGSAMEDVIFSGSTARGSVNMAEVTLVLDNSDQTLPVDFAEVAITRRMYRSGESEYLINNTTSRLLDVTEILHDSGIGREMHSIISQGNLDSVLSSRPEDRRELIEEAAGISKHRRRKARSERRLKSMDENLVRAKDIAREIARQLRPLERQVGRARQAREVQERLSTVSLTLAVDDLRRLQALHAQLTTRVREAEAASSLSRLRLSERSGELERYQSLLEEQGLYVGDLSEQRARVAELANHLAGDARLLAQKGRVLTSRIADLTQGSRQGSAELSQCTTELASVRDDLTRSRAEWDELKRQTDELAASAREAKSRRQRLGRDLADAQARLKGAQREADAETLAHAKLRDQAANAEVEDGIFRDRIEELTRQVETCSATIAERRAHTGELEEALKEANGRAARSRTATTELQGRLKDLRRAESSARDALNRERGKLAALESQDEQAARSSALVAALMRREAAKRVQCRLADLIEAPSELEGLVERLLGEDLAALVVDNAQDAADLATEAAALTRTKGTATVLRHDVVGTTATSGDVPGEALLERLVVAQGAEGIAEALLGGVWLVETSAEALAAHDAHPTLTFVAADGTVALPDGRLRLGEAESTDHGALERKRRLRALRASVPELEAALDASVREVAACEREITSAREEGDAAKGEVARISGELKSITSEIGRIESQRTNATAERSRVEHQREVAASKAADARAAIERHRKAAEDATERARELSERAEELADERAEASEAESAADRRLSEARLRLATVQERKNGLITREDDLTSRIRRLSGSVDAQAKDLVRARVQAARVAPLEERLRELSRGLDQWQVRLADSASLAEADSAELKQTIGDARSAVDAARSELERNQQQAADAKVELGRVEVKVEGALAAIEEMGVDLAVALETEAPDDREALEAEREQLSRRLTQIGPVNEVAMEQYEELKQRSDYIAEQVADLESARKSLAKITSAIERKMRTQFLQIFDEVNRNFTEIFALLFPGGAAHLEMTDPDHVFETGIEVQAQPRGKKIQKMTLMSGGEKSLTALALLFAVYKTRTVPFYVFDEVEAALDDSNLGKLLDAIDQLRRSTQLIVISHQRRTMEQADVLYGVSMQADGVSHVVSQRLEHNTERK